MLETLNSGLKLPFVTTPNQYSEDNNSSVLNNLNIVQDIVDKWEKQGIVRRVSEPPTCVNPLSLVENVNSDTGEIKYRLVIDQSRYVNKLVDCPKTKLQDLSYSEPWLSHNTYQTSFD